MNKDVKYLPWIRTAKPHTPLTVDIKAANIYLKKISDEDSMYISIDGSNFERIWTGIGFHLKEGNTFKEVSFLNKSAFDVSIIALLSGPQITDSSVVLSGELPVRDVSDAISNGQKTVTTAGDTITANTSRRELIIENKSSTINLRYGDGSTDTTHGLTIKPGKSAVITVTAALTVCAESGTVAIEYMELE